MSFPPEDSISAWIHGDFVFENRDRSPKKPLKLNAPVETSEDEIIRFIINSCQNMRRSDPEIHPVYHSPAPPYTSESDGQGNAAIPMTVVLSDLDIRLYTYKYTGVIPEEIEAWTRIHRVPVIGFGERNEDGG